MIDAPETQERLKKLEQMLGVSFDEPMHLLTAITHRSYLNEHREATQEHNERYEFLGDAVLELVVTDFLFNKFPEKPEGELTAIRAALVNTNSLADASTRLGVNDYLLLSRGEERRVRGTRRVALDFGHEAGGNERLDGAPQVLRAGVELCCERGAGHGLLGFGDGSQGEHGRGEDHCFFLHARILRLALSMLVAFRISTHPAFVSRSTLRYAPE
jgi:hypothetical protein